jgi:hypothetical protein
MRRVTTTYDEEMDLPREVVAEYNSRPVLDRPTTSEELDVIDSAFAGNYEAAASERWHDQARFMGKENEAMRMVNIKHPYEIFRRLRSAGVDARIEAPSFDVWVIDDHTGKPIAQKRERSIGRLWLADNAVAGRVGVSAWVIDKGERVRKQVATLQYPYGPEWSLLYFNEFDVPIGEKYRGWRTALLQMILAKVLTEDEVNRAFGPVPLNNASLFYRRTLYNERTRLRA